MQIIIPGNPIPKMRPRSFLRGGHIHVYDPQEKEKKEARFLVESILRQPEIDAKLKQNDFKLPLSLPICIRLCYHMPIPVSLSEGQKNANKWGLPHAHKPDLDNLTKWTMDILNKILYSDDSQIVQLTSSKLFSETPCTIIDFSVIQKTMIKEREYLMKTFTPAEIEKMCVSMRKISFFWDELSMLPADIRDAAKNDFAKMLVEFSNEYVKKLKKIVFKE